MFKENKEFWFYFFATIIMFFVIYSMMKNGFESDSLGFIFFAPRYNTQKTAQIVKTNLDLTKDYVALISTNYGDFTIDLYEKNAPNTVSNFISLANSGYYEGTSFYRLIPNLLIQGGSSTTNNTDPNDDIYGGPGYTIPDETDWDSLDYSNTLKVQLTKEGYTSSSIIASKDLMHYSVAMASNGPNTGGGQFFIIMAPNTDFRLDNLKGRHTVFGGLTGGYNVFDAIAQTKVDDSNALVPRPINQILINKVTILIN